jgi:AraC-like DNA-binding protein
MRRYDRSKFALGADGGWPDYILLGPQCVQRHVGPRHVPESPLARHDVEAAGVSDLSGRYAISRSHFGCHVVFFTLSGEGLVEFPGGARDLRAGDAMVVPAGCAARYRLAGPDWQIAWFDLCDTGAWSWLRGREVTVRRSEGNGALELSAALLRLHHELGGGLPQGGVMAGLLAAESVILLERALRPADLGDDDGDSRIRDLFRQVAARLQFPWRVATLARTAGVAAPTLHLLCRQRFGTGPMHRVATLRMDQAKVLLAHTLAPVADVAASVGYANALNFSTAFRRHLGCSPRTYRKRIRQGIGSTQ